MLPEWALLALQALPFIQFPSVDGGRGRASTRRAQLSPPHGNHKSRKKPSPIQQFISKERKLIQDKNWVRNWLGELERNHGGKTISLLVGTGKKPWVPFCSISRTSTATGTLLGSGRTTGTTRSHLLPSQLDQVAVYCLGLRYACRMREGAKYLQGDISAKLSR